MPSVPHDSSFLSLVKVKPLTMLELNSLGQAPELSKQEHSCLLRGRPPSLISSGKIPDLHHTVARP
jgi:hypothetical protein